MTTGKGVVSSHSLSVRVGAGESLIRPWLMMSQVENNLTRRIDPQTRFRLGASGTTSLLCSVRSWLAP
jgi:hypothetical protein